MNVADAFAEIALGISSIFGGPYHDANVITLSEVQYDNGGSVIPGTGGPVRRSCSVQADAATERMRTSGDFTDKDMRLIVIALDGALDTDARIEILDGPHAGMWMLVTADRDSMASHWECQGRPA